MASNPYVNKVEYGGNTLIDISDTTATAADVLAGKLFYLASGAAALGTASGGTIEKESGTWTPSSDVARGNIPFTNTHSKPPTFAVISCSSYPSASTNVFFCLIDTDSLLGVNVPYSSSTYRHGIAAYTYRGSSGSNTSSAVQQITYGSSNTGSSDNTYYRYYATASAFTPYTGSGQRYWRSSITYTWAAYWI